MRYWIGSLEKIYFKRIIKIVKEGISAILEKVGTEYAKSEPLNQLCLFLQRLYEINETDGIVNFSEFYIKTAPSGMGITEDLILLRLLFIIFQQVITFLKGEHYGLSLDYRNKKRSLGDVETTISILKTFFLHLSWRH